MYLFSTSYLIKEESNDAVMFCSTFLGTHPHCPFSVLVLAVTLNAFTISTKARSCGRWLLWTWSLRLSRCLSGEEQSHCCWVAHPDLGVMVEEVEEAAQPLEVRLAFCTGLGFSLGPCTCSSPAAGVAQEAAAQGWDFAMSVPRCWYPRFCLFFLLPGNS